MIALIVSSTLLFFSNCLFFLPTVSAQTVKVGITSKTLFFMPYYVSARKKVSMRPRISRSSLC